MLNQKIKKRVPKHIVHLPVSIPAKLGRGNIPLYITYILSNSENSSAFIAYLCFLFIYFFVLIFLECPIGLFSDNCSEKCSPPNYGEDCQSICQCPDIDCHFVTGCLQDTKTLTTHWQLSINSFYQD